MDFETIKQTKVYTSGGRFITDIPAGVAFSGWKNGDFAQCDKDGEIMMKGWKVAYTDVKEVTATPPPPEPNTVDFVLTVEGFETYSGKLTKV